MKKYIKPYIEDETVEIEDIIADSNPIHEDGEYDGE